MQVTVETTTGLERKLRVAIPEDRIKGEVQKRLGNMAQTARLPGFRPGKAPMKVITQRFGRQVRNEVVGEIVQSSFYDAIMQERLRPAGRPTIEPDLVEVGEGITYTAVFDVFPEMEAPRLDELAIVRPETTVAESDIDGMIATLQRQRKVWSEVARPATPTDRVVIDFEGSIDGEVIQQASAQELPLELDARRMIDGFEQGLVGTSAGDEKVLDLRFPDEYHAEDMAGKQVSFNVTVKKVEESSLPALDEDFVKGFAIEDGTVDSLRNEIRNNMTRELTDATQALLKQRVMDALMAGREIELPTSLIEEEQDRLLTQRRTELVHSRIDPDMLDLKPAMFEEPARRRVGLSLLLAEIIKENDIKPDPERVRARIETLASSYEDPDEVIGWYYSDRSRLSDIESTVLEDQVVEWILEKAKVTTENLSFDQVMNPGQTTV